MVFFFQAEGGIRYLVRSRGLGDVYKRQPLVGGVDLSPLVLLVLLQVASIVLGAIQGAVLLLSLIHI